MLKVIIVDDEIWAIEGLKQAINWSECGCEITGTFTSASKALDFISRSSVDIVFADVSMPGIDGLTMVERIKQISDSIHIVIVSGFMEFENARRCISLGVDDFFVKPADPKNLLDIIKKVEEEKTEKKQSDISELSKVIKTMRNSREENIEIEYMDLKKKYSYYFLLMADRNAHINRELFAEELGEGRETVRYVFSDKCSVTAVFTDIFLDYSKLIHFLQKNFSDVQIGISGIKKSIFELPSALNECRLAYFGNFITGQSCPCEYIGGDRKFFDGVIRRIHMLIKEKSFGKINALIEQIFTAGTNFSVDDIILLANCVLMASNINFSDFSFEYIPPADRLTERFSDINELREHLLRCIGRIMVHNDGGSKRELRKNLMPSVKEYVDEHFQEQISLTVMAEKFGVSEKNIGKMFKKYTGENYTAYVNQSRIDIAVKMLSETDISIQEISEICGYRDYSYFARVFKKLTGVNATDIKRNKNKTTKN